LVSSPVENPPPHQEDPEMATATVEKKNRSGSRAPKNPKTKAQRLTRVQELTERIDARLAEVDDLTKERNRVVKDLRDVDHATFREIGHACGKSEQAIHKAFSKK
jgi:hypothetical protein